MKVSHIYEVTNNRIIIDLPDSLKNQKSIRVTMENTLSKQEKITQLSFSANDPLFQADIKSVQDDFQDIDFENI
jgi:hypothetical protein